MSAGQHHSSLPLREPAPSWYRSLRARNLSPRTIAAYRLAINQLTAYLEEHDDPHEVDAITADAIRSFLSHVLETRASATDHQTYASLVQLFRWLRRESEIEANPMERVDPPKVEEKPVPVLSDTELKRLPATCKGKAFEELRDTAILRLFIDTGIRLGEMASLGVDDVDLDLQVAIVRGKGNRLRTVPFGDNTTEAIDRTTGPIAGTAKPTWNGYGWGRKAAWATPASPKWCCVGAHKPASTAGSTPTSSATRSPTAGYTRADPKATCAEDRRMEEPPDAPAIRS